jgi:hypothetical protein
MRVLFIPRFPRRFLMKRVLFLAVALLVLAPFAAKAADASKISGWISDSMCGAKHMGSGADCVKKCIESGGMKPVFVDESKKVWAIDNPESVKNYYGDKVTVTVKANKGAGSVHIEAIQAAK